MRWGFVLLGVLVLLMGVLPFAKDAGWSVPLLERIPTSGTVYSFIIIVLGLAIIFGAVHRKRYLGVQGR
ncbi:MAG: hypothetical protein AABX86_00290 [Nanoarchaeota archaeon]